MGEQEKSEKELFGLVGKNISYSFSRDYFSKKFEKLGLKHHEYVNFDISHIEEFPRIIHEFKFELKGLNVTIPYKEDIFLHLDKIHKVARKIGAVNTIRITKKGNLKGYNTDAFGFKKSIEPLLEPSHKKALILGTGGASKAVSYVLKNLNIDFLKVSRTPKRKTEISYKQLTQNILKEYLIIINCSPVGTYPRLDQKPAIPYQHLTDQHLLYDLIYNPEITAFLEEGRKRGAQIKNGLEMLELQAEEAWRIWNK